MAWGDNPEPVQYTEKERIWNSGIFIAGSKQMQAVDRKQRIYLELCKGTPNIVSLSHPY